MWTQFHKIFYFCVPKIDKMFCLLIKNTTWYNSTKHTTAVWPHCSPFVTASAWYFSLVIMWECLRRIKHYFGNKFSPFWAIRFPLMLWNFYRREGRIVSRSNTIIKSLRQCRSMLLWIFDSQISSHNTDLQTSWT